MALLQVGPDDRIPDTLRRSRRGERTIKVTPGSNREVEFSMREEYTGVLASLIGRSIPNLQPAFEEQTGCRLIQSSSYRCTLSRSCDGARNYSEALSCLGLVRFGGCRVAGSRATGDIIVAAIGSMTGPFSRSH